MLFYIGMAFSLAMTSIAQAQVTAADLVPSLLKVGGNTSSGFEKMTCEQMIKLAMGNASQTGADFLASKDIKASDCEKSARDYVVESTEYKKCKANKEKLARQLEYDKSNFVSALIVRIAIYDTKYLYHLTEGRALFPYKGCTPALVNNTFSKLWNGQRGSKKTDAELVNIPELLNYCQVSTSIGGSEPHEAKLARLYAQNAKGTEAYKDRMVCQQLVDAWNKTQEVVYAPGVKRDPASVNVATKPHDSSGQCSSQAVDCSSLNKSAVVGAATNPCFNDAIIDCMVNGGGEGTRMASDEPTTERSRSSSPVGAGSGSNPLLQIFNGIRSSGSGKK